jgi:hypothetical protein
MGVKMEEGEMIDASKFQGIYKVDLLISKISFS